MDEYLIRKAIPGDIPFLADVIIASEKGRSENLSFTTLFNVPEDKAKELIINMLEEEIDGCELSLSSFYVTEYKGQPVSGSGAWIEGFGGCMPSKILKSNLISYTFGTESIEFLKTKSHIIKDVMVDREPMTLQLEYFHIVHEHQGKGLDAGLMERIEADALAMYPELEKAQCQIFKNNVFAIKILLRYGYKIVKSYKSDNKEIFDYLPYNEKCLIEKSYK